MRYRNATANSRGSKSLSPHNVAHGAVSVLRLHLSFGYEHLYQKLYRRLDGNGSAFGQIDYGEAKGPIIIPVCHSITWKGSGFNLHQHILLSPSSLPSILLPLNHLQIRLPLLQIHPHNLHFDLIPQPIPPLRPLADQTV